jgi:hypothetical protein
MILIATRLNALLSRCKSALTGRPIAPLATEASASPVPAAEPSTQVITEEMLRLNRAAAERHGVEAEVHPKDFMYLHHVNYWFAKGQPLADPINYYFQDGEYSATKLAGIVASLDYDPGRKVKLLEFASGYGCVSRNLKKLTQFELVSCDIHRDAIDFLRSEIGVKAILSAHVPEQFAPPETYDVVFALSFFTHMPRTTWGRWLRALYNTVNVPGYLIFTTHGRNQWELQKELHAQVGLTPVLSDDGYWFQPISEQKDLDTAEYGSAVALPEFVHAEVARQTGARSVKCQEAEWWGTQDLWIIKRES